jgi:hypothetical protein
MIAAMEELSTTTKQVKLPKWILELQNTSWYPEIVISLGAIFSLLALSDSIIHFGNQLKFSATIAGLDESILIFMIATKGITVGFIIHIVLRAFWISLLCLNYAYPNGINFNRLHLSARYKKETQQHNLTNQIAQLDKTSGLVFFGSLLFVIISTGLLLTIFVNYYPLLLLTNWLQLPTGLADFSISILNIFALLFLVDFLTAGLLRKNKIIGALYFPFYTFYNYTSLAFIYRPWVQIIFSNVSKWKALGFSLTFMVITVIYSNIALVDLFHWKNLLDSRTHSPAPSGGTRTNSLYDDQLRKGEFVFLASIPTDIIQSNYVRVFVPYRSNYSDGIKAINGKYFSDIVTVSINDSTFKNINWISMNHKTTNQLGIVARLPVDWLPNGQHQITIKINDDWSRLKNNIRIPFWKD